MTTEDFNQIVEEQINRCRNVLLIKKEEYAAGKDRLAAFKKAGAIQDQSMEKAALGMLSKHLVSISDMILAPAPELFGIDRWNEKITDAINYLLIIRAIIEEEAHGQN